MTRTIIGASTDLQELRRFDTETLRERVTLIERYLANSFNDDTKRPYIAHLDALRTIIAEREQTSPQEVRVYPHTSERTCESCFPGYNVAAFFLSYNVGNENTTRFVCGDHLPGDVLSAWEKIATADALESLQFMPDDAKSERSVEPTYRIVRFHQNRPCRVIREGVTLAEAQRHCNDPATRGIDWFDGYEFEVRK